MSDELDDILKGAARENLQRMGISERSRTPLASNTKLRARAVVGETELHDWEARCLMERTPACKRVYLADEADREIERLTRERDTWRGHYQDLLDDAASVRQEMIRRDAERDRLRAALERIKRIGPLGVDTYPECYRRMHAIAVAALSGEPTSAVETSERRSLPPGPERIAAQIAHATYHIIDDHGAEDAQTGVCSVEIPKREWDEWNRIVDLLGDDPHEVLHDLIGVNDPEPSEKASECQHSRFEPGCTLKPCHPSATHENVWEYRCGVCQQQFSLAIGSAQNGEG